MKKRLIMVIVSIVLSVAVCLVATGSTPVSSATANAYMEEELVAVMKTATADELIPVDIWLNEIDTDKVETMATQKIEAQKQRDIQTFGTKTVTDESKAIDTYIETKRETYAELQTKSSEDFLSKYTSVFDSRNSEEKLLFVSKYTPVISAQLTIQEIKKISTDNRVVSIYYSPVIALENESNISIPLIRSNYVRDTLGYSGSGIKIGLLEAEGMPNRQHDCFTTANIYYDPNVVKKEDDHANKVASILVAKPTTVNGITYKGIVPNAKLYATYSENLDTTWKKCVEWLLSQGVHVINMSAGSMSSGTYGSFEKWVDHIAINHSVHFVEAAGNFSYKDTGELDSRSLNIISPALAYNVITVGNLDDKNTAAYGDDEIGGKSSYKEQANLINKPDLVAPGTNINTPYGNISGTSFAAPHVTAVVAQLCQAYPTLKTKQDAMKAILMASINHSKCTYTPYDAEFDKYGAGMVDARSAIYTAGNSRYVSSNFAANAAVGSTKNYTFNVTASDEKVRVALAWLKYSNITVTPHEAYPPIILSETANLCVWVYGPDGNFVEGSGIPYGNTQVVEFVPTKTGTYRIEVEVWDTSESKIYFGLAWW